MTLPLSLSNKREVRLQFQGNEPGATNVSPKGGNKSHCPTSATLTNLLQED